MLNLTVNFCSEHLPIKPHISGCFCLGRNTNTQPRRLLLKLTCEQSADELLKDAQYSLVFTSNSFFNPHLSPQQQLAFEARCRKQQKKLATDSKSPSGTTESQIDASRRFPSSSASSSSHYIPTASIATNTFDASSSLTGADQRPSDSLSNNIHQLHNEPELVVTNSCRFQSK